MYKFIILDTNIYRQLGAHFYDHIDYKSLKDYCYASGSELVVPLTVLNEYLDYYQNEVIGKGINEIQRGYEKLKRLDKFAKVKTPDLKKRADAQISFVRRKLLETNKLSRKNDLLNEADLLDFLIENKQEGKKDNTRDYLIWLNAISFAVVHEDYHVMLISDDKIFTENEHFQHLKQKYKVKNISIYKNIPAYLSEYGFNSPLLTRELILKHIPREVIKQELLDDKNSIPSHISRFYYDTIREFKLEKFAIEGIRIESFYAHKETKSDDVDIIAHIQVKVNMVFEPEHDMEALRNYLERSRLENLFDLDTFDQQGRPIFNDEILFLFTLSYSDKDNKITSADFIDFFPDDYKSKRIAKMIT